MSSSQCGICTDTIVRDEGVVVLYGNEDSTSFRGLTRPFPFCPFPGLLTCVANGGGLCMCRGPGCAWYSGSPEAVPVHRDCLHIFRKQCSIKLSDNDLERLWVAAAWRTPWRGALRLHFPMVRAHSSGLGVFCRICKLPPLHKLPLELYQKIKATSMLRAIVYWERGKGPREEWSSFPLLIRITVDSIGIAKIERISRQPYEGECRTSEVYMILHNEQQISGCTVHFKDGSARLELGRGTELQHYTRTLLEEEDRGYLYRGRNIAPPSPPAVWNTPNPPDLLSCQAYEINQAGNRRFFAVELARIRGISFFFSSHKLRGVHVGALSASPLLQRMVQDSSTLWCYLPITNQDRVLVLGVRVSPDGRINILARMEKVGDVILGQYISSPAEDLCLCWHPPITLIHREPQEGLAVPYFGAYCQPPTGGELPKHFQRYQPKSCPIGEEACLSTASLEDLRLVEVFYDENGRYCRGMLLYYQNGGCRAVGQCRVGLDSSKQFSQPSRICFRMDPVDRGFNTRRYDVQVDWRAAAHTHEEEEWKCEPLEGVLVFWYNSESSFITIDK
ncbi:hypothetical protein GGR51DRAFT_561028 [Nemania sp. FL0031]|nr:hypothetical protein GGR51DRAFT_561028 [Nemania sp. FL0031]